MAKKDCEGYEHHMMYSPEGKGVMTSSCQQHLDLSDKGWGHTKPKKKKMKKGGALQGCGCPYGMEMGPNTVL
tara:strand:- start:60 stop:275 length:216 start_codon:yes stop_codon:yes gene_type:complete